MRLLAVGVAALTVGCLTLLGGTSWSFGVDGAPKPVTTCPTVQVGPDAAHAPVELYCQNLGPDGTEKNSVIFTVTPYLDSVTFGEVKRKLECRLVRQGEDDVEYELKSTPADGGIPETKRIVFKGAPVVVFENAAQRITLQFQGSTRVVGTVYGKPVTAGDIGMAKTINPDVEFDAQNRALWEQTGRILRTFGKPVEDAFVAERQLTFTDDDIAKYRKWVRWSNAQALNWCRDDLVAIDARLAVPDLNDDKRAKLVKERELIVQSIRERTESRDREISEQEARLLGWPRKIEYELYRVYGGRVIFQQFGPESWDGRRKLYEEAERRGDITFKDEGVRHLFYYYYVRMRHHGSDDPAVIREQLGLEVKE